MVMADEVDIPLVTCAFESLIQSIKLLSLIKEATALVQG
jgi:hypothetical protein